MKKEIEISCEDLLEQGGLQLHQAGLPAAFEESIRILAAVLDIAPVKVRAGFVNRISAPQAKKFFKYLKLRALRMPLQYITGRAFFMGMKFFVNENVLIPRNETEILAEEALKEIVQSETQKRVLDLGTGSGCIAVFLASSSNCRLDAVEISPAALEIAHKNARAHGVSSRINFINSDMLKPGSFVRGKNYDIIISNPPYIAADEYESLPQEVKKEPRVSLKGGKRGLKYIEFILKEYGKFLKPEGKILIEMGYRQKKEVEKISPPGAVFIKDLSGINRVVKVSQGKAEGIV